MATHNKILLSVLTALPFAILPAKAQLPSVGLSRITTPIVTTKTKDGTISYSTGPQAFCTARWHEEWRKVGTVTGTVSRTNSTGYSGNITYLNHGRWIQVIAHSDLYGSSIMGFYSKSFSDSSFPRGAYSFSIPRNTRKWILDKMNDHVVACPPVSPNNYKPIRGKPIRVIPRFEYQHKS